MGAAHPLGGPTLAPLCLALLCLWAAPGVRGQEVEVLQPGGPVTVKKGDPATLSCTVGRKPPIIGAVRWYKGSGQGRELIYSPTESSPRVSQVSPESDTDFSIIITDVSTADAGTYYCVKFRRSGTTETEYRSGPGTGLSVGAPPSPPKISPPSDRVEVGDPATFTCSSEGFSPEAITVTWSKGGEGIKSTETTPSTQGNLSFGVTSTATVTLSREDIKSRITCQITHSTLTSPLTVTSDLRDVIRVSPQVKVQASPAPTVQVNTSVVITCTVGDFYPNDASVTWSVNNTANPLPVVKIETPNPDGTFSLTSSLEFNATERWNQTEFICQAMHQGRTMEPLRVLMDLTQHPTTAPGGPATSGPPADAMPYYVAGTCALLLLILIAVIIIFIRAKKKKEKDSEKDRSKPSGRSTMAQDPDPKELTYADIDFQGRPKSRRAMRQEDEHCEYACVQTGAPRQNDNLTYADLDTVRLNLGPSNARPSPAEASSEYAEVQVQRNGRGPALPPKDGQGG